MLSSSQDGTVRLWSLDTYSNLVVYRGHGKDPVWDVEWGPMGVYFATASRDRTARLWSSDRVTPLRMYTGHLSDVNVSLYPTQLSRHLHLVRSNQLKRSLVCSASNSIQTLCILQQGQTMLHVDYGMYRGVHVSGCLWVIQTQ